MKKLSTLFVMLAFAAIDVAAQDGKPLSPKETVKGTAGSANVEIV
jgi:hypothetical protein